MSIRAGSSTSIRETGAKSNPPAEFRAGAGNGAQSDKAANDPVVIDGQQRTIDPTVVREAKRRYNAWRDKITEMTKEYDEKVKQTSATEEDVDKLIDAYRTYNELHDRLRDAELGYDHLLGPSDPDSPESERQSKELVRQEVVIRENLMREHLYPSDGSPPLDKDEEFSRFEVEDNFLDERMNKANVGIDSAFGTDPGNPGMPNVGFGKNMPRGVGTGLGGTIRPGH
jgi:hypothetical protein